MTHSIAFLTTPLQPHNDNHLRLPEMFAAAGWQVDNWPHDSLNWQSGELYCGERPAEDYDLVWPIGLGPRTTYLDRQELLCHLSAGRCINAPQAYVSLHGKSAWLSQAPPTYISQDAQLLEQVIKDSPGEWVLKPLAGSFGRDVHKVTQADEAVAVMTKQPNQYWVLQAFIADIRNGETRTLICADQIIGSYLRKPKDGWHANLATEATAHITDLNAADAHLVHQVCGRLREAGVRFAAVDTAGGYVVEVNLANPGGLGTLSDLYGEEQIQARMLKAIERLGE